MFNTRAFRPSPSLITAHTVCSSVRSRSSLHTCAHVHRSSCLLSPFMRLLSILASSLGSLHRKSSPSWIFEIHSTVRIVNLYGFTFYNIPFDLYIISPFSVGLANARIIFPFGIFQPVKLARCNSTQYR